MKENNNNNNNKVEKYRKKIDIILQKAGHSSP